MRSDAYVGEIRMFAGKFSPSGWLFCNGQVLNIHEYAALYSVIGVTYGGDGVSTFALPDTRGRIPVHQGYGMFGTRYQLGECGGEEAVTLSVKHLPSHSHSVNASSASGTTNNPSNAVWAASSIAQYATDMPRDAMHGQAISVEGRSKPHDNMMPFLPLPFIISTEGELP